MRAWKGSITCPPNEGDSACKRHSHKLLPEASGSVRFRCPCFEMREGRCHLSSRIQSSACAASPCRHTTKNYSNQMPQVSTAEACLCLRRRTRSKPGLRPECLEILQGAPTQKRSLRDSRKGASWGTCPAWIKSIPNPEPSHWPPASGTNVPFPRHCCEISSYSTRRSGHLVQGSGSLKRNSSI